MNGLRRLWGHRSGETSAGEGGPVKLIVGLGNPGAEYAGTRHNAGFEVIEVLARRHNIAIAFKRNFKAEVGEGRIDGQRVLLARPQAYMNLSGESVGSMARFYKIPASEIMVILDDTALPLGRLRLRLKGSAGGHNGLTHILTVLHTDEVPRIRIGVGAARPGEMIGHVLSRFRKEELPAMEEAYTRAADAVECALAEGFETAMNRFNVGEKRPAETKPAKKEAGGESETGMSRKTEQVCGTESGSRREE
ncbi:MAG TPA: aminoacyl-tRNA hydrolase [Chthonomonadaceae bacterium]|nr:aminoacyl-tRNA hydrolase [Chthonomonadaceae bacterium]